MLSIPPSNAYNLNQGQKAAADAFLAFLFSPDKEFRISGPAGTGKTYLMNYIIDNTMPRYLEMCKLLGMKPEYDEVMMTATTNKAADVLSTACNRPTQTVHSFFNLTVKDDYETGVTSLKRTPRWMVHQNKIIFVDESSMIDGELHKTLHEGTLNCKLVYVGDRHQLAPVHEDLSPVYKIDAPMVELLEPMRNSGQPALMNICAQLRRTVETGVHEPIQIVPGVIDLLDDQQMQAEIQRHFHKQTHEAKIMAYTNKRVIAYNDHIRGLRALPAEFQVGEYLVCNGVIHYGKTTIPVETEVEVMHNAGANQILVDEEHKVYLDINRLRLRTSLGDVLHDVPVATNREHFNQLVKYYAGVKNFKKMYNLKNMIADLRPIDAATVHKSQGSTYDTVFIDIGNIGGCNFLNQVPRLLYVAFSRARSRVFLYGDLPHKYGGPVLT
ncbi:ATP-dependent DNA helicase [Mesorhizobium yinganensis]|uniref:ATP-dependent DNA helicase n=1 Tax=Mesorhizobium yinganensis TaxID=3157707 RepID=UPI0032B749CD